MRFVVKLTDDAFRDLEEIHEYIAEHDAPENALYVLDRMDAVIESLALLPERGSFPKELLQLGIHEYRQVFFKPYRVIYNVVGRIVHVLLIVDGRRDMEAVLARRLLGGR